MGQHNLTCDGCNTPFTVQKDYDIHRRTSAACKGFSQTLSARESQSIAEWQKRRGAQSTPSSGPRDARSSQWNDSRRGSDRTVTNGKSHYGNDKPHYGNNKPYNGSDKSYYANDKPHSANGKPHFERPIKTPVAPSSFAAQSSWPAATESTPNPFPGQSSWTRATEKTWAGSAHRSDHNCRRCARVFAYKIDRWKHMKSKHPETDPGKEPTNDKPSWDSAPADNSKWSSRWNSAPATNGTDGWGPAGDRNGWGSDPLGDWQARPTSAKAAKDHATAKKPAAKTRDRLSEERVRAPNSSKPSKGELRTGSSSMEPVNQAGFQEPSSTPPHANGTPVEQVDTFNAPNDVKHEPVAMNGRSIRGTTTATSNLAWTDGWGSAPRAPTLGKLISIASETSSSTSTPTTSVYQLSAGADDHNGHVGKQGTTWTGDRGVASYGPASEKLISMASRTSSSSSTPTASVYQPSVVADDLNGNMDGQLGASTPQAQGTTSLVNGEHDHEAPVQADTERQETRHRSNSTSLINGEKDHDAPMQPTMSPQETNGLRSETPSTNSQNESVASQALDRTRQPPASHTSDDNTMTNWVTAVPPSSHTNNDNAKTNGIHAVDDLADVDLHTVDPDTAKAILQILGKMHKRMAGGFESVKDAIAETKYATQQEAYDRGSRDTRKSMMDDYWRLSPRDFQSEYDKT